MKRALSVLAAALLGGCAAVQANVTKFHQLGPKGSGEAVYVGAVTPGADQTLEFRSYAAMIGAKLAAAGYRPVESPRDAALIALVDYGVMGKERVSGSMPLYGQTGGGVSTFSGQAGPAYGVPSNSFSGTIYTPPTFGVVGSIPYSEDVYHRRLAMTLYRLDRAAPERSPTLFEGTVSSAGSSSTFNQVAGCLVEALFTDFPGKSGATDRVEIPGAKCGL